MLKLSRFFLKYQNNSFPFLTGPNCSNLPGTAGGVAPSGLASTDVPAFT
jgi:hypothetical protein